MTDVFVSYKREERDKVEPLVKALESLGLDVWYDYEIVAGDQFERVISERLNNARAVVVCWSKAAAESEWVQAEADKARASEKFASVLLEPCEVPMPYNVLHWADLTTWSGTLPHEGFRQLVNKLAALVSPTLKRKYAELSEAEKSKIEAEIRDQGGDDDVDVGDRLVSAPPSYLFSAIRERAETTGRSDLSSLVLQASFEEEILRDERTTWIVANTDGVPQGIPEHCRLTRSLEEALRGAKSGECVVVLPGTYAGKFEVTDDVRIVGFGSKASRAVLTGKGGDDVVLKISGQARIENLEIESRQKGHALLVVSGSPTVVRCVLSRLQLVFHDWASVHAQTGSRPTFLACTISGTACPAIQFAGNARGQALACDISARDGDAVVLTGSAKPSFDRCTVIANDGHAVKSTTNAAGLFENCLLRSSKESVLLNCGDSFSKFVGNRIVARQASLIVVDGFARGRFERNRLEPCPELRAIEEAQRNLRRPLFRERETPTPVPPPIKVSPQHRAKFAENRLPDGSVALPNTN
ncbi:MAG: TIR domain-containing protein [Alphaproteobacteria bacterium]